MQSGGVDLSCPACRQKRWQPSQYAIATWVQPDGSFAEVNGEVLNYLLLPLYCQNCAYMVFFNAGMMEHLPAYFPEVVPEVGDDDKPA